MAFRVGQKVVCVDTDNFANSGRPGDQDTLRKGETYTVAAIGVLTSGRPGICVEELTPILPVRYSTHRFRPLVEKKTETGMAILQEILDRESIEDRKPARVR